MIEWKEQVEHEFIKNINDTYTLNLAISILEDVEDLRKAVERLNKDNGDITKLFAKEREETKRLNNIIKEVREYIEENLKSYSLPNTIKDIRYVDFNKLLSILQGSDRE